MKLRQFALLISLLTLLGGASAQTVAEGFVTMPGKATVIETVTVAGQIVAIDKGRRIVGIKTEDGQTREIIAGPDVRNFDQVKVGDAIVAQVLHSLTLELKKGGAGIRERTDTVDGARTEKGQKPGGVIAARTVVMADVVKVDKKASTVTLRGVQHSLVLKIADPEQLKLIAVGDQVRGTYVEAVGIAVMPAAKKS